MMEIITGYFINRGQALEAADYLRSQGFKGEISVLGKGNEDDRQGNSDLPDHSDNLGIGLLQSGFSATIMQGVGPIFATGPIAGFFYNNEGGELIEALNQWGVPDKVGKEIKGVIENGNAVILVECNSNEKWGVRDMLDHTGAQNIHI
jgi:hypothetical protein